MTTIAEDIASLKTQFEAHVQWDADQHAMLRKEHEVDFRDLIQAINGLRTAMKDEANKIILVMLGGAISTVVGVAFFVVPHIR